MDRVVVTDNGAGFFKKRYAVQSDRLHNKRQMAQGRPHNGV